MEGAVHKEGGGEGRGGAEGGRRGRGGERVCGSFSIHSRTGSTVALSWGVSLAAGFFAAASVFPIVASNDRCGEGLSGVRTLV